ASLPEDPTVSTADAPDEALESLLEFLKKHRNFDFTGYKRASLQRRIDRRMQDIGTTSYAEYMRQLEDRPEEFASLFDTVLINVTAFFRDDAPWKALTETVIPDLIARRTPESPIRVWSAGCATGEEAYTLAMVLAEVLGEAKFRERVKIYATDVDEAALTHARHAVYSAKAVEAVPEPLRAKYFDSVDGAFAVRKEFRRSVIFGRNDLILDAPIPRTDVIVCRNTLMYFRTETQEKILNRFHFSLNDDGVLLLGRAETLLTHSSLFVPLDLQRRLFIRSPRPVYSDRRTVRHAVEGGARPGGLPRLRELAFDSAPIAQVVIDRNGFLVLATERARALFGVVPADFGRPLQDLEMSYRPVELRSCIDQAYSEQRTVHVRDVAWHVGEERWFDISVTPLDTHTGSAPGVSIVFSDITSSKRLQHELERSNHRLEVSYEELQSTNEEMETTNEELQATIEELETTNEELQSTNEELETMNEELQSTNEELHAVNDESQRRSDELNQLNAFLESVFASLGGAVIVVDPELKVIVWNDRAEDLWGLRSSEVEGTHFLNLDIGLPVDKLRPVIKGALADGQELHVVDVAARNRRGKEITCRVQCTQLRAPGETFARGAILQMEEAPAP
ncbi:MAG: CheR family methyltransferase, partial [Gemmatimonadaceae bacterium]